MNKSTFTEIADAQPADAGGSIFGPVDVAAPDCDSVRQARPTFQARVRSWVAKNLDSTVDDAARDGQRTVLARFLVLLMGAVLLAANVDVGRL